MSTKKKTTPKPAPFVKPETKKTRTLKEISADIKANIRRAQEAFSEALSDVKALAELAAQAKPVSTPVKGKTSPVKEKGGSVKQKTPSVKGKAAPVKPDPVPDTPTTPTAPSASPKTPASVTMTPHEITLYIGSQPVRELAENDAKDLLNNSKVFLYQPLHFPDPRRYGVQPRITAASVVQRKDPRFTRAPWTVRVTVEVLGDDKKTANWCLGVYTKNKADQE